MEKKLLAIILLFLFIAPVYAESSRQVCTEEAKEAGMEEQEEVNFYINECMAQMATEAESGQDNPEAAEAPPEESEVPPGESEVPPGEGDVPPEEAEPAPEAGSENEPQDSPSTTQL